MRAPFHTVSPVVWPASCLSVVNRSRCSSRSVKYMPGVAHVRALLGGDDVERLLGQAPAEVDRHPLDARVAPDLDPAHRQVVHLAGAPVLVVGEVHLRARLGVQLERAGVQRLALEVGSEEVLADLALGVLAHHHEGVGPLDRAGLVDQPDGLDRLLDLHVRGHVHEHAAGPERGVAGGELALVVRAAAWRTRAPDQVGVLLHGLLERHHDDAVVAHVGVHDAGAALDDQRRVLLVAEVLAARSSESRSS